MAVIPNAQTCERVNVQTRKRADPHTLNKKCMMSPSRTT